LMTWGWVGGGWSDSGKTEHTTVLFDLFVACLLSVFAGLTVSWSRYVGLLDCASLLRSCWMNGLMTLSSVRWRWSVGSPHRGFPGPLLLRLMPLAGGPLLLMLLVWLSWNLILLFAYSSLRVVHVCLLKRFRRTDWLLRIRDSLSSRANVAFPSFVWCCWVWLWSCCRLRRR